MSGETQTPENEIRYEPEESPPPLITVGLALQFVILTIAAIVLTVVVVGKAANQTDAYISWAVFISLIVCGICCILQAIRVGRIGAGHILLMGTSGVFIAICVSALEMGGPALLATLVVISSLVQFLLATKLSLLRNIITPAVSGTVIMLIPVTVMPIVFGLFQDVPAEHVNTTAPIVVTITLVIAVGLSMRASGWLRLWTPILGILVGTFTAIAYGLFDTTGIFNAAWLGFPTTGWGGIDLSFDANFWVLLPSFVFVTIVGMIETIGDAIGIQRISRRNPGAPDYRVVQGAVGADGVGNLLSGLGGTVPNTTYSSTIAITELTGIASRKVGVYIGVIFIVLAFFPKFQEVIAAIPNPVAGAYLTVILAMLFVVGIKIVVKHGLDYRQAIIVGVSFWIGVGFQFDLIFPELFHGEWEGLLQNGMTVGGVTAMFLSYLMHLLNMRLKRLTTPLEITNLNDIQVFLTEQASKWNWSTQSLTKLELAAEETLLTLLDVQPQVQHSSPRQLRVTVRKDANNIQVEFVAVSHDENIEDRILLLNESDTTVLDHEISLRILKSVTSDIKHQQYFGTDIITLTVTGSTPFSKAV